VTLSQLIGCGGGAADTPLDSAVDGPTICAAVEEAANAPESIVEAMKQNAATATRAVARQPKNSTLRRFISCQPYK
jgi:hypothetical protein